MDSNWINSYELIGLIKPAIQINKNPYYQKWKRGRPTKDMIRQRELSQKWEMDNNQFLKLITKINNKQPNFKHEEINFLIQTK